ncbi:MAG: hypothetical protein WDO74_11580 [Pseudomonadota bacterium]
MSATPFVELHVGCGHDDAHAALAEHPLDPELSSQNLAFSHLVRHSRAALEPAYGLAERGAAW